jgi:signal transduction histidine kinase
MSPAAASLLVLAAAICGLGGFVLRAAPSRLVNRWFAAWTIPMGCWILGVAAVHMGWWPEGWGRFAFASASVLPGTFLGFTAAYPRAGSWPPRWLVAAAVLVGVLLAALSLGGLIVHEVEVSADGLRRKPGPLYGVFAGYFLACWLTALGTFLHRWRKSRGLARVQLQFLGAGLVIATVGGLTSNLLLPLVTGRSSLAMLGPFSVLPLVLLVSHAIIRHRLLDLRLVLGRGVAMVLLVGGLSAVSVAVLVGLGWTSSAPALPLYLLIPALITAIAISAPIAPHLTRAIDRYLGRGRPDLDRALRDAVRGLARLLRPLEAARALEQVLVEVLAPEYLTILIRPMGAPLTDAPTSWESIGTGVPEGVGAAAWRLAMTGVALRVVEGRADSSWQLDPDEAVLDAHGIEVFVTLKRGDHILGTVLLGPRRDGDAYSPAAIRFLEELAVAAAAVLETGYLHEHQLTLERDRERLAHIARLGRSYATLAHEIRTPLATISNFVSGLGDRIDDPEYRDLIVRLVPAEVNRIVALADRLQALAPSSERRVEVVDLARFLKETASLLSAPAERGGHSIHVEFGTPPPQIAGQPDRLRQLFQNLIKNAMEAMPDGGRVVIALSSEGGNAVVRVFDEGLGLSPHLLDSPFEAFVSTKRSGLGLGLSICREIAAEHGARISLRNRSDGRGAVAEVVFPLATSDQRLPPIVEGHHGPSQVP